jgi:predicted ATP-grasp superfamily ATP-dependent carboligase
VKILLTDGHLKAALSAVRSLGRKGYEVHAIQDRTGPTLCSLSAYLRRAHILPPYESAAEFDRALLDLLRRENFDYLIPVSDGAVRRLSALRSQVETLTRIDLAPEESLRLALCKVGLVRFADSVGVPVPRTYFLNGNSSVEHIRERLTFPMVAKTAQGDTNDRIRYVNTARELQACMERARTDDTLHLQEFVQGRGCGCFMLFERGKPVLSHMHERLWEYPITGGPSVLARTFHDPVLLELASRLLTALNWNGLAMVEFKKSAVDGGYRLMEINPRLWGSLDLSLAAGFDFPSVAVQQDRAAAVAALTLRDASYLWVLPDGLLFLAASPSNIVPFMKLVCSRSVHKNIRWDDPRPMARQFREVLYYCKVLLRERRLRYPHGKPFR